MIDHSRSQARQQYAAPEDQGGNGDEPEGRLKDEDDDLPVAENVRGQQSRQGGDLRLGRGGAGGPSASGFGGMVRWADQVSRSIAALRRVTTSGRFR